MTETTSAPEGAAAFGWPVGPAWPAFEPGSKITLVKRAPDGSDVTSYPGTVVGTIAASEGAWVVVEARWVNRQVDMNGLSIVPGDRMLEAFSPVLPFNAFAVHAPDGTLRGWYANVTYPSTVEPSAAGPVLVWRDLYLDIVALPDGMVHVRDEDELAESNLAITDPDMHAAIVTAKDELLRRWRSADLPFGDLRRSTDGERQGR